ncbi:MAG: DUF2226 domain-containing protein, partial [Euryarchaeota archaeon]|nr:DUF2226 domain-containing protein [Euryarchaeota archaeon]
RGEIVLESPLEFVDLNRVLKKVKDKGYVEFLITKGEMEEGYVFLENGDITGIFYEGHRKEEPLKNVQQMLNQNPSVIFHKLTETQAELLKDAYPLDENYKKNVLFEAVKAVKKKKDTAEKKGLAGWNDKVPILKSAGQMSDVGREELLEGVDDFVRSVLEQVDGKRTIGEIAEKSGNSVEDVLGVVVPYQETGYIGFIE